MRDSSLKIKILIVIFLTLAMTVACQNQTQTTDQISKVSIGLPAAPGMALVMVAEDRGFFDQHGIDVVIQEFTAGKFALQAFLGGSLDFVASGELPVMFRTLQGSSLLVPAQIVKQTHHAVRVVAHKDGELNDPGDPVEYFKAKPRKLATSIGGGPEFFTYQFFKSINLDEDQVEIISMQPAEMPAALTSGSVDAIAIFDPFAYFAEQQLGDQAITFSGDGLLSEIYILDAHQSIKTDPTNLEKILKGLLDAEKYIQNNPEQAKAIVAKYTQLDPQVLDAIWDNFEFQVVLTQDLIDLWRQEAEWVKETNKVQQEVEIMNFRDIIFEKPLQGIAYDKIQID